MFDTTQTKLQHDVETQDDKFCFFMQVRPEEGHGGGKNSGENYGRKSIKGDFTFHVGR